MARMAEIAVGFDPTLDSQKKIKQQASQCDVLRNKCPTCRASLQIACCMTLLLLVAASFKRDRHPFASETINLKTNDYLLHSFSIVWGDLPGKTTIGLLSIYCIYTKGTNSVEVWTNSTTTWR